jgi:hypothetical protein
VRCMYLGLVERMVVFCSWMRCPKLIVCSAKADSSRSLDVWRSCLPLVQATTFCGHLCKRTGVADCCREVSSETWRTQFQS